MLGLCSRHRHTSSAATAQSHVHRSPTSGPGSTHKLFSLRSFTGWSKFTYSRCYLASNEIRGRFRLVGPETIRKEKGIFEENISEYSWYSGRGLTLILHWYNVTGLANMDGSSKIGLYWPTHTHTHTHTCKTNSFIRHSSKHMGSQRHLLHWSCL
jgi:hypothetical protein